MMLCANEFIRINCLHTHLYMYDDEYWYVIIRNIT